MTLPKEVAHTITRYGQYIIFENLWNYHDVNSVLDAHNDVDSIAVEFENQLLFWRRVDEYREQQFSSFQSQVSELAVSPEVAQLLISVYLESPRVAEKAYHTIETSQNGGNKE